MITRRSLWSIVLAPFALLVREPVMEKATLDDTGDEYICSRHGETNVLAFVTAQGANAKTFCMACIVEGMELAGVACCQEERPKIEIMDNEPEWDAE